MDHLNFAQYRQLIEVDVGGNDGTYKICELIDTQHVSCASFGIQIVVKLDFLEVVCEDQLPDCFF